jgi:carbon catabolite-derepressing protein kinase
MLEASLIWSGCVSSHRTVFIRFLVSPRKAGSGSLAFDLEINRTRQFFVCIGLSQRRGAFGKSKPLDQVRFTRIGHCCVLIPSSLAEGSEPTPESHPDAPVPLQRKYRDLPSDYYIPRELWYIRARLLKEGVTAPGASLSAHSSRSDLDEDRIRRTLQSATFKAEDKATITAAVQATLDSVNASASGSTTAEGSHHGSTVRFNHGVWVFIDIQLYQLEANNYMVDFKCDGYQNVIRADGDTEWRPVSRRIRNKEKAITSPYPYLDVASDLVAQLAAAS